MCESKVAERIVRHILVFIVTRPRSILKTQSTKNSLAVKKGAALFKMASVKKVVKSKRAAKKWL